jgi:hypothetical protein
MSELGDKIVGYLRTLPCDTNPYDIAKHIGAKEASVRVLLRRLLEKGEVIRVKRGYYTCPGAILEDEVVVLAEIGLHGIKLEYRNFREKRGVTSGTASDVTNDDWRTEWIQGHITNATHRHAINGSITQTYEWHGRVITETIYPQTKKGEQLIELWLRQSDIDLRHNEVLEFISWLEGRYPHIPICMWRVRQVGINWDIRGLHLDGVTKFSLQMFKDLWFNLYNHARVLRIETHSTQNVPFLDVIEMFAKLVKQFSLMTGEGLVRK